MCYKRLTTMPSIGLGIFRTMDPKQLFVDERWTSMCAYCGAAPYSRAGLTRDHVPSKVLLDPPYPPNLGVVQACEACNNGLSRDELYFACFLEAVINDSAEPSRLERRSIARRLEARPSLQRLIGSQRHVLPDGTPVWKPDLVSVNRVLLKLARGHSAYELGEVHPEDPDIYSVKWLSSMSEDELLEFLRPPRSDIFPELGSRAFFASAWEGGSVLTSEGEWKVVQEGRYSYTYSFAAGISIRLILRDRLACRVDWL